MLPSDCMANYYIYRNLQCESKNPPPHGFLTFFPNSWEFLINFLHTYYVPFYTRLQFLFNYFQLSRSYAILSATTQQIFTFH